MSELPEGWAPTQLGVLLKSIVGGGTPSKSNQAYFQGVIPFMTVKDLHDRFVADTQDHITEEALEDSASTLVPADTLIIATRMSLGKITRPLVPTAINQDLKALFLHDGIDKTYVEYLWRANEERIKGMGTGTTVKGIRLENIRGLDIPLAPSTEQTRIANQLDTLLTRIQACNDRFDAIPALLKRFRQAVLGAATSGELTEEWRDRAGTDIASWNSVPIGDLIKEIQAGLNVKCEERPPMEAEKGLVKISAVTWGRFDEEESKTLPVSSTVSERVRIRSGDFLISRANTVELVGACVIVGEVRKNLYLSDKVLRLVVKEQLKPWLLFCLRAQTGRQQIESLASGNQLSMRNLSQANLKSIVIPIPTVKEQAEITRRVETLFALADRIEARCTAAHTKAQRLTPLVLAKAFRGELVQQEPNDEPASQLLAKLGTKVAGASQKLLITRAVKQRKKTNMKNSEKEAIKSAILSLEPGSFLFEELRMKVNGDYESIKEALFELLQDTNPVIQQVFDEEAASLKLVRVKK